ncbi:DUF6286 domain-containing protein [Brevibacterium spongiae]|uniref:DUF6286 domain-containing protein n=1 Tax=Brevibacterium spongiae TaxID=2909672 RepID=A0ABY5SML3_9MICO|nr:DUF6286 domain-containing protein [Brevibacterium spongiae]UVI35807.1 DUF6286 domain-containing protein [Brevibacterium spongiae]
MSTRLLRKRPSRIGPAVVVALILLLLAVGLGWASVAAFVSAGSVDAALTGTTGASGSGSGLGQLGATQWSSGVVIGSGMVLAILGLIALILGIAPGARRSTAVSTPVPEHIGDLEVAVPTAALSHIAAAAADGVDGVSGVKASSNAASTIVTFSTPVRDHEPIRAEVEAAVRERFDSISFDRKPTVKVQARRSQS